MIKVKNLVKTFKTTKDQRKKMEVPVKEILAVDNVSFECRPGRIFSLLGPNGAGKTTTLRIIAALMKPSSGSVEVNGYDVSKQDKDVHKNIGFLTGSTKLYDRLSPREIVKYYGNLYGLDKTVLNRRIDEYFTVLDMHSFADQRIGKLSSGMKQKTSIVRTMIHDPQVLVFDEATVGLDVITSKNIVQLVRKCKDDGKTIIFSTHIMGEVALLSDDLAIIHKGKLLYNGEYKDFCNDIGDISVEEGFIKYIEGAAK